MNAVDWGVLMRRARAEAAARNERVKVKAVMGTPRRHTRGWLYVIECPSYCPCRRG